MSMVVSWATFQCRNDLGAGSYYSRIEHSEFFETATMHRYFLQSNAIIIAYVDNDEEF